MDRGTEELLDLIRLTERVSAEIHGILDEEAILQTVADTFRSSRRFHAHIIMLDGTTGILRVAATSFRQTLVKLGETLSGVSMKTFRVELAHAPLMARVLQGRETIQVSTAESLADLLPSKIARRVLKHLDYEGTTDVLTPLHINGRPLGILSVTAPGLAKYFIPSLKNLAHHVSASLELAAAVRDSESAHQRYRDLVENLNEIIYTVDMEGTVTYLSPNISEIGFSADDLVGKPLTRAFDPEQGHQAKERFARYLSGDLISGSSVYSLLDKDGMTHWIRISSRIATEGGQPVGLRGSVVDVTEARAVEAALKESKRVLDQTGYMARIGGWEHNIQTGEAVWTRELYRIIEIDPQEQPPGVSRHLDFYPPADRARLEHAYSQAMETGQPFDLELEVNTSKGRRIWCRVYGEAVFEGNHCVKMRGTFQDIDDAKQVQRARDESERRLETLMSNLPGMAYRCQNVPDWTMEFVSAGCTELTGYEPGDLVDSRRVSFGALIVDTDRDRVWETIQTALQVRQSFEIEYRIRTAEGNERWVWEQGQGVFSEGGTVIALEGFITDISDRRRAEEALSENQERLRLALDGTILAVARTVELRDPYTSGHQERVAHLACAIATEMRLDESFSDPLRVAGLLHDVGKISVPSEILSKPARLTDGEMELVRAHAEASYKILEGIDFPWPIAEIVRQHHERLDGSGYPRRLAGDDICTEARILAVADVVEAIASHRPYRPAFGIEVALEEIEKGRGITLAADAVDACIRLFREQGASLESLSDDACRPENK